MVGLQVRGLVRDVLPVTHPRPKRGQAKLQLEGRGPGEELLVIPGGMMDPKSLRMELVDRDVDVLVIGVVVTDSKDQEVLTVRIPMARPSDNRTAPVATARA